MLDGDFSLRVLPSADFSAQSLVQFSLAAGLLILTASWGARARILTPRARLLAAAVLLLAPLFSGEAGGARLTITTLAIVAALRLIDLPRYRQRHSRWEAFLWLLLPVFRRRSSLERSERLRGGALRFALALLKGVGVELLLRAPEFFAVEEMPLWARSGLLILYFVTALSAIADALIGALLILGFECDEVFDWPLLSSSPREFWSRRWNLFIARFALRHVALPLGRRWPPPLIVLGVFALSGIFHEYFVLANAGWGQGAGFMSLFFVLQAGIVLLTGSLPRWIPPLRGREPGMAGHVFTVLWMLATAPLFFHALEPVLLALQYPASWLPYAGSFWQDWLGLSLF